MSDVSILIPNFRTPILTKLCLRSLRKYTDTSRCKVLVIDNGSGDGEESLEYLRSLKWITLLENHPDPNLPPAVIHSLSMDKLLHAAETEFILSMHTDTIIKHSGWLNYLLEHIQKPGIAGVGSWKLEKQSLLKKTGKRLEDLFRERVRNFFTNTKKRIEEKYLRSHCALYRRELVIEYTKGFYDGMETGHSIHNMLHRNGFGMLFLPESELGKYMVHINHATMILNPEIAGKKTSRPQARKKIAGFLGRDCWDNILMDTSLDL